MGLISDRYNSDVFINTVQNTQQEKENESVHTLGNLKTA